MLSAATRTSFFTRRGGLVTTAAVIYLGEEQFLPRLKGYLDLASALRERVPDIDYVDLRFDERIYVRPRKK